jgi:hypothetical protein
LEARSHFGHLMIDGRILLKWILMKWWTVFSWFWIGPLVGFCEHSSACSGSMKAGNFVHSWVTVSEKTLFHAVNLLVKIILE